MIALLVIAILGATYFTWCLASRRPENAVFGHLLVWLMFPKYIQQLPVLGYLPWEGVRIFEPIQFVTAFSLLAVCFTNNPKRETPALQSYKALLAAFALMVVTTYFEVYLFSELKVKDWLPLDFREFVRPTVDMLYAVIFGWACSRYINDLKKVETILALLMLSGIELTLEVVLLYYGNFLPGLRVWVLDSNNTGRFNSIAFLSFDTVGLISIVNICATVYFILSRRRYAFLVFIVPMSLPIVATLAKAPFTGLLLALSVTFGLAMVKYRRVLLTCSTLFVLTSFALDAAQLGNLPNLVNGLMGAAMREDNSVQQTLNARYGLWLRGVDIFLHNFPLGAGNGVISYNMAAAMPMHLEKYVSGAAYDSYSALATREYITNVHNMYIEFVAENGVFGLFVLLFYAWLVVKKFFVFLVAPVPPGEVSRRIALAQSCLYGGLVGMGWRFIYEAGDKLYFLLFLLLYLTYLLPKLMLVGARPDHFGGRKAQPRPIRRTVTRSLS